MGLFDFLKRKRNNQSQSRQVQANPSEDRRPVEIDTIDAQKKRKEESEAQKKAERLFVQLYEQGMKLFSEVEYERAVDIFDKLTKEENNTNIKKEYLSIVWQEKGEAINQILNGNLEDIKKKALMEEMFYAENKAVEIDPTNELAWFYRMIALKRLGRYKEMLDNCEKLIELGNDQGVQYRAIALKALGKPIDIENDQKRVITNKKALTAEWRNKGHELYSLGRFEEALTCYNNALDIDQDDGKAWLNKGQCEDLLGRKFDAAKSFRIFLKVMTDESIAEAKSIKERLQELDSSFARNQKYEKNCAQCGKTFRQIPSGAPFPTEWTLDTVESKCRNCGALVCHDCRRSTFGNSCPRCGVEPMITVSRFT